MAVTVLKNLKENKKGNPSQHLKNAIVYIMNPKKTENGLWCGGNCGTDTAEIYNNMIATKTEFGKRWGRQGYHFVISFPPGEADEETTYKVGKEFCEKYLRDGYDYCFAVHNDHAHMHCHIIFNSVNRISGYKYRYIDGDWGKKIQPVTDGLCRKYHLAELKFDREKKKGKSYAEHLAEKEGRITGKDIIRADMDVAAYRAAIMDDFYLEMKKMGYQIRFGNSEKHGRYIAYTPPGLDKKARRDYQLGEGYRISDIERKIRSKEAYQEKMFCEVKLPVIKGNSAYQRCMVLRIRQAVGYHFYELREKDQARVRRDLMKIGRLEEECRYIITHDIQTREDIERQLETVRKGLKAEQNTARSARTVLEGLPKEERKAAMEYRRKKELLQGQAENLTDEEFETLSDALEEMEQKYGALLFMENPMQSTNMDRINRLKEERRLLLRLRREMEETLQVKEAAKRVKEKKASDTKEEEVKL